MYISMIHDLYIALCAHHPKSSSFLSPNGPLHPSLPPHSLPSTVFCVCKFKFYIPHMNEVIWFLGSSGWLISLSIIFSRSTMCSKWQYFIFSYSWVVFHSVCIFKEDIYLPYLLYPNIHWKTLLLSLCIDCHE